MSNDSFQFTRVGPNTKTRASNLSDVLPPDLSSETWLLISPHDDDIAIGAGILVQAAVAMGVNVHALIVTDGSQGYCRAEDKERIVDIRRGELYESFRVLGVIAHNIHSIGYPDASLFAYQGRRPAAGSEAALSIGGHIGLQNALTYHLRRNRPKRVFVPTPTDLHPDHQVTYNELMISLFHAHGAIWPELGTPLTSIPTVYEWAVYCDFREPPNLEIQSTQAALETKLSAIASFRSQAQIGELVKNVRDGGSVEYFREVDFRFYSATNHRERFA